MLPSGLCAKLSPALVAHGELAKIKVSCLAGRVIRRAVVRDLGWFIIDPRLCIESMAFIEEIAC